MIRKVARLVAPPPNLKISEWAENYRYLSQEASSEPGKWKGDKAPYQRGIMDAFSDPKIEAVVIMSSAQVGKTEIINNIVGYHIHLDACPILLLQPTLEMAESWSKDRFAPMLRDTEVLHGLVKDPRSRDSGNTLLHKRFPGGHVTMAGANSPASLASRPIRLVLCDEVDRYPASAGTEGDPVNLARKRSTNFWNRKLLLTSTPTIKGVSRIEAAYEQSDQRKYHVPCPSCDEYQVLKWARVQWDDGKPDSAVYVCEHHGCIITDSDKQAMLLAGQWIAHAPFEGTAGFHLSELYSPWVTFAQIAADFLKAKKLPETLKTWVNTSLGETWEDEGEKIEADDLLKRKENWGNEAPEDVLVVTAGVDVQGDRLECEVKGWGIGQESWSLDYRIFYGDPAQVNVWQELDSYLQSTIRSKTGTSLHISCACIDSGGHHTQAVYEFCKSRALRGIFAIKGSNQTAKPLVGRPSTGNRMRVRLYPIGTDTAKEVLFSRLRITEPGPGYYHFPASRDKEYFLQLTAEKLVTKYTKGTARREWIKTRSRNEVLDCNVYALAALHILNVDLEKMAAETNQILTNTTPTEQPASPSDWIPRKKSWLDRK